MMTKQTGRFAKWRILAVIPVLGATLLLFSFTEKAPAVQSSPDVIQTTKITEDTAIPGMTSTPVESTETLSSTQPIQPRSITAPPPAEDDEPFVTVENMPRFEGGDMTAFRNWVMSQIKYPVEAQQKEIEGRVVVGFVIERDGTLSYVKVHQSPNQILSEEAVRAVSASPKWTPGTQRGQAVRVQFSMPVDFRLNNSTRTSSSSSITVVGYGPSGRLGSSDAEPTIMVNGVRYTGNVRNITPEKIDQINVVKDDPDYPNGVIHIKLKEGESNNVSTVVVTRRDGENSAGYTPGSEGGMNKVTVTAIGTEGQASKITVNGIGNAEGKPLFIVDGTPVSDIKHIPADNIESISVLKDESSTRIYGEEGKNGVIIITTKEAAANN